MLPVAADVASSVEVQALVDEAAGATGRIDVLINNARIDYPGGIETLECDQWDRVIAVNLSAALYAAKAVYPLMKAQRSGYIVNISSVAGRRGAFGATAYCASKFGMTGLTQALMTERKTHNIRASVVYPGGMDTGWTGEPRPDFLSPDDAAGFVLNLVKQPEGFVVNEAIISPVTETFYP